MYMEGKKRLRVRVCVIGLTASLFCGGCQATPEKEIVAGKNAERLESVIGESNTDADNDTETGSFVYKDEFRSADGSSTVKVNANVIPLTGNIPVYRVTPKNIEVEDVQKWADYFFQGEPVYDKVVELSRSEIEAIILELKRESDSQSLVDEYGNDPEFLKSLSEDYDAQITYYEELYKTAPEEVIRKKTTWEFRPSTYYAINLAKAGAEDKRLQTMKLKIEADVENSVYEIWATNREERDYILHNMYFVCPDEVYERGKLSGSEEEARRLVNKTLADLGMNENWKVSSCAKVERDDHNSYYLLNCQRYYDGVPVAVLPQLDHIGDEEGYAALYFYETLEFMVSGGRICAAVWESPLEVRAIENSNVKVLPWEAAAERFRAQMEVQLAAHKTACSIDRIEQGLTRIKVPDKDGEFYLVPAWHFYGSVSGEHHEAEGGTVDIENPVLTLNAIDGTVINTVLGY